MVRRFFPARTPRQIPPGARQAIIRRSVLAAIAAAEEAGAEEPTIEDVADKIVWYSIRDGSTLFTDPNRTIVAGLGVPIAGIHDKSGNERHAQQIDPAKRSTYQVVDGLPAIVPDGTDDIYNMLNATIGDGPRHWFLVADLDTSDPLQRWLQTSVGCYVATSGSQFGTAIAILSPLGTLQTRRCLVEIAAYDNNPFAGYVGAFDGRWSGVRINAQSVILGSLSASTTFGGGGADFALRPWREFIGFARVLNAVDRATVIRELLTAWHMPDVFDHYSILNRRVNEIFAPLPLTKLRWRWVASHGVNLPSIVADGDAVTGWHRASQWDNPPGGYHIDTITGTVNWRESDARMGDQPVVDVASGATLDGSSDDPTPGPDPIMVHLAFRLNGRSGGGQALEMCRDAGGGSFPVTFRLSISVDSFTATAVKRVIATGVVTTVTSSSIPYLNEQASWLSVHLGCGIDNGHFRVYSNGRLMYEVTAGVGSEWVPIAQTSGPSAAKIWECGNARIGDMLGVNEGAGGLWDAVEADFLRRFNIFI